MNRRLLAVLAVFALFVTGACGDDDDSNDADAVTTTTGAAATTSEALTVTSVMDGSTQNLKIGQDLVINLDTSGGTGYSWKTTTEPDPAVLKFVSSNQEKKSSDTTGEAPLTGTPELSTTVFSAVGAGTTKVVLGHIPPSGAKAEDAFSITVTVTE